MYNGNFLGVEEFSVLKKHLGKNYQHFFIPNSNKDYNRKRDLLSKPKKWNNNKAFS